MARTLTAFTIPLREDKLFFSDMWTSLWLQMEGVDCICLGAVSLSFFHLPAEMPQALACFFPSPTISHSFFLFFSFFFLRGKIDLSVSCSTSCLVCLPSPPTTSWSKWKGIHVLGWDWPMLPTPVGSVGTLHGGGAAWVFVILLFSLGGLLRVRDQGMFFYQAFFFFFIFHLDLILHSTAKSDNSA